MNIKREGLEPRYKATYTLHEAGHAAVEHIVSADYEITMGKGVVLLDVAFDEAGDQFRSLEVKLDGKAARELAYTLLLFANTL